MYLRDIFSSLVVAIRQPQNYAIDRIFLVVPALEVEARFHIHYLLLLFLMEVLFDRPGLGMFRIPFSLYYDKVEFFSLKRRTSALS
jgi:hypothetical protein